MKNNFLSRIVAFFRMPHAFRKSLHNLKRVLLEQFNRNIYTRIVITNTIIFVIAMIIISFFATYMVNQAVYRQVEDDLARKSTSVNFAISKEKDLSWLSDEQTEEKQDLLKFLADSFDVRITVFDQKGTILNTSAEQEAVPGSKVESEFIDVLTSGETLSGRIKNKETNQLTFQATIPMGNTKDTEDTIKYGILIERQPVNLEMTLNKMRIALLIGGMIILVIIIVISSYLAMFISRPFTRLATIVTDVRSGSYTLIDEHESLDEINALAVQLNFLTDRLEKIQSESGKIVGERAQLFAEISHELRTPLTAVQGFTEAIRDNIVEDENLRKKYIDMIYTQTLHLARLVDDIMSLSRLESGDVTIEKAPIDLVALSQGVVMTMEGLAKVKGVSILFEKKIERAVVIGDVDRLEQILRNLIKNAISATENGIIKVGVESLLDEVVVKIEDNGIGISPDDLPHIWDRFYRVKNQRTNNIDENGTGLGLVIVKKLIQLQNGKIDVESQLGNGTSFYIRFSSFM